MSKKFKALRVHDSGLQSKLLPCELDFNDLTNGDVLIKVEYSSINYKDALAVTGKGKILRSLPLNPGIDMAGEVIESSASEFKISQKVFVTGCGLGEIIDGGLSEYVKVPANILLNQPKGLDSRSLMALGTAGFTAGLAFERMKQMGQVPSFGPIAITGASGGVGSFATALFSQQGFDVIAVSNKKSEHKSLLDLGAKEVVNIDGLNLTSSSLGSVRFGGAVDNLGGEVLAKLIAHTQLWGSVAAIGLAADHEFKSTVMPFILRGVNLLGISSANCPKDLRIQVWQNLAKIFNSTNLNKFIRQEIHLGQVYDYCQNMLDRKTSGRCIVKL